MFRRGFGDYPQVVEKSRTYSDTLPGPIAWLASEIDTHWKREGIVRSKTPTRCPSCGSKNYKVNKRTGVCLHCEATPAAQR